MPRPLSLSLGSVLVALAATGCELYTGSPPTATDAAPAVQGPCAPDPSAPGATIVACGLGPLMALVGADDGGVYAVSPRQTFVRAPRAGGPAVALFHGTSGDLTLDQAVAGTVVVDGAIYFPQLVDLGPTYAAFGLVAIATDAPTAAGARTVIAGGAYTPFAPVITDGDALYAASTTSDGGDGAFSGPVIRVARDGSGVTPMTTDYGVPIAIADGYLYYTHDRDLERVPLAGGPAALVVAALADSAVGDRAIADGFVYTTTADAPYAIRRVPVTGGAGSVVATVPQGGEIPSGPPTDLRVVDGVLYYLEDFEPSVVGGYRQLTRLPLDGASAPAAIAQGPGLSAPVFDATRLYVAYQRGGGDAPIEGVIAALPR